MRLDPSPAEFRRLALEANLVPVTAELMADFETPVSVYAKLRARGPAYLLESIEGGTTLNRYSFIGCQPRKILRASLTEAQWILPGGETVTVPVPGGDPLRLVQRELEAWKPARIEGLPRFTGGAVGMLGYEYVHSIEPTVPIPPEDPLGMPVVHFFFTDTLVIFDRARQTLRLLVNARIDGDPDAAYQAATEELADLARYLEQGREVATVPVPDSQPITVPPGNYTPARFEAMVERCREYIRAGDVIQVVGSQRFEKAFTRSPLDLYRALRVVNPSPYMFLYDAEDFALVGASPEVHVRLTDGLAELRPIAGTRPRGTTKAEDLAHEADLLADEKERAEHLMLVDLARNDLGRVCQFGSVKVPEYMVIERYSHVMHIVSQVEGQIAGDRNAYDLMRATFPAGTVSGAPKVRAMQIIAEQEQQQRGPYAGAVCYFSYGGNLDSCIAIRTALLKDEKVYIQSGAGLVADSQPRNEYEETINKAKGMLKAVALAESMNPLP